MTRLTNLLLAFSLAALTTAPAFAQFLIAVQQNGQAVNVNNGGTITINAPAVGQTATATVNITYVGPNSITFANAPQIIGTGDFTTDVKAPVSIASLASTSFHIQFTSTAATQDLAQFSWGYTEPSTTGTGASLGSGIVNFSLVGTAPSVTVNNVQSNGTYLTVPNGGTFQFATTPTYSTSSLTIAISNSGTGSTTVNSIAVAGGAFQLQGLGILPLTISAQSELRFTIQFTPTSVGPQTGSLQITTGTGSYGATLAGSGTSGSLTYQLIQDGKTSSLTPNQSITFDGTSVGSTSAVTIQFQNSGTSNVVLNANSLALSGAGFSFTDGPFLPLTLAPQQTNSITVTYAPTAVGPSTGRLLIGTDTFLLSGTASGSVFKFSYQVAGSASVPVAAGNLISFSPIAVGQSESLQFTVTNAGNAAGSVQSFGVADTTGAFKTLPVPLPVQLAPGASATFTVEFMPSTTGLVTSTLVVNNQTFAIGGFGSAPPSLPEYQFAGPSGTQPPFAQPTIGLSLDTTYPSDLTGTLTISVSSSSFAVDPAVQFSTGGTKVTFTIPANTLQAIFPNGSTSIQFQTGTVASTIVIRPSFALAQGFDVTPTNPLTLQLVVPSQIPTILSSSIGSQTTTGFSVFITGYTTTRSLDHINLQFTAASGVALSSSNVSVDLTSTAMQFFSSSTANGGQFDLEIPFNLGTGATGTNLSKVFSSISVVVVNAVGNSATAVIKP